MPLALKELERSPLRPVLPLWPPWLASNLNRYSLRPKAQKALCLSYRRQQVHSGSGSPTAGCACQPEYHSRAAVQAEQIKSTGDTQRRGSTKARNSSASTACRTRPSCGQVPRQAGSASAGDRPGHRAADDDRSRNTSDGASVCKLAAAKHSCGRSCESLRPASKAAWTTDTQGRDAVERCQNNTCGQPRGSA